MNKKFYLLFSLLLAVQLAIAQSAHYEFWMDNDYEGRTVSQSNSADLALELDISSIKSGLHYFNFRVQDENGLWGGLSRSLIILSEQGDGSSSATANYEYWFDNQYNSRTIVSNVSETIPLNIDLNTLKPGLHYFNFRTQSRSGQYGGLSRYLFFVKENNIQNLKNLEYWIDENGNRQTQEVTDSNVVLIVDISDLAVGEHTLYVEGVSQSGSRGMLNGYQFTLNELPVVPNPVITHEDNLVTIAPDPQAQTSDSLTINPTYYYTLDGTTPDSLSNKYEAPFEVTQNGVVKAKGYQNGFKESAVDSLVVDWFKVANVAFVQDGYRVSLSTETEDAAIHYTLSTSGTEQLYGDTLSLEGNCTITAWATRDGYLSSDTTRYEFNADSVSVAAPRITRVGNVVKITTATEHATIHYTMDGTMPDSTSAVFRDSIVVERNCMIKAIALRKNFYPSAVDSLSVDWFTVSNVEFAREGRRITLMTAMSEATILYVLSTDAGSEQVYSEPLMLSGNCTLSAWATRSGYNNSDTTQFVFVVADATVSMPQITLTDNVVKITTATENAAIYYTLDGTTPTAASPLYADSIVVDRNCTVKAIALRQNWFDSEVATFEVDIFKVPNVQIAQDGYSITMSNPMDHAVIHYTQSGTTGEQTYSAPIALTADCTINVWATREGFNNSDTIQFVFTAADVTVATPQIVNVENVVKITTATDNAAIYYTLDGTTPTATSPLYADSIVVDRNCTVKAIAMRQNWFDSEVATLAVDIFKVPSVQIAQDGYSITMSNPMDQAVIHYTQTGTTGEQTYSAPISLTADCTLAAWATREGYNNSDTIQFVFTAADVKVATPRIVNVENVVKITTATENAAIYYTLDGTTPTATSQLYADSIVVDRNCTVKAIAMRQNWFDSEVATHEVDIFKVPSVQIAQDGYSITMSNPMDQTVIHYTQTGTTGEQTYSAPISLTADCTINAWATREGFNNSDTIQFVFAAADVRVATPQIVNVDNVVKITTATENASIYYTLDGTAPTATSQVYADSIVVDMNCTVKAIAMRQNWFDSEVATFEVDIFKVPNVQIAQDGYSITMSNPMDQAVIHYMQSGTTGEQTYSAPIALTADCTISAWATREGFNNSDTIQFVFTAADVTVATPQIVNVEHVVKMTTATENATIRYTLDGTTPTSTSQLYADSIVVERNCTVKAIAMRQNWFDSEVATFEVDIFKVPNVQIAQDGYSITMSNPMDQAVIHYTQSGITGEQTYSAPIALTADCTINAWAIREGFNNSDTIQFVFTAADVKVATPQIVNVDNVVKITTATDNAAIRYTLDGTTPTAASQLYADSIVVDRNCTVKAIAMRQNWFDSEVATLEVDIFKVPNVQIAQDGYSITMSNPMDQAVIHYTQSGTTGEQTYSAPIALTADCTINAWATREGFNNSDTIQFVFTAADVKVATPQIVNVEHVVKMTSATENAGIYYTLDGTTPTATSQLYADSIVVERNCTVKAIAMRQNWFDSEVATHEVDIFKVPTVQIAQDGYSITMSNPMDQAVIHYTQSGTTGEQTYSAPIALTADCTINAWAIREGFNNSDTIQFVFTAADVTVATPQIVNVENVIKITTATENADIYYTLDGTTPTATSLLYADSIVVERNCTVKAIAMRQNWFDSEVATLAVDIFKVATVQFEQDGEYLTMTSPTADARIFYTMTYVGGVVETPEDYVPNGYRLHMLQDCTVDAYAMKDGWENSDTVRFVYQEPVADYAFDGRTLRVSGDGKVFPVMERLDADAATTIAAIQWDVNTALTDEMLNGIDNPNLLVYVAADSLAPLHVNNVVVGDVAKQIVLTDTESGNGNFFVPREFKAESVSYTRDFRQSTQTGISRGWETIALPFGVQTVSHELQGEIAPFGSTQEGKRFWLRQLSPNGLQRATEIEANVPYLISMPNSEEYTPEFNLAGRVTFSAVDVVVPVTEQRLMALADSSVVLVPTTMAADRSSQVWALNVGQVRGQYLEGSVFERDYREVRPFEAYIVHHGIISDDDNTSPRLISLGNLMGGSTGIQQLERIQGTVDSWWTLDGRKLQEKPAKKGIYIHNGQKRIVK